MFSRADQFNEEVTAAQKASKGKRFGLAVLHQEKAITILRSLDPSRANKEIATRLSIELYNLAGYQQGAGHRQTAVATLEEVVAIDEKFDLPDKPDDVIALNEARLSLVQSLTPKIDRATDQEQFHTAITHQETAVTKGQH